MKNTEKNKEVIDEMNRLYDMYNQKKDYISISKTGIIGDITPSQMSTATQFALSNLIQYLKREDNLPYLHKDLQAYLDKFSKKTYENIDEKPTKKEEEEEEEQKELDDLLKQQFGPHTPLSENNMNLALNAYTASQTNSKPKNKTYMRRLKNGAQAFSNSLFKRGGSMSKKKRKTKRRK